MLLIAQNHRKILTCLILLHLTQPISCAKQRQNPSCIPSSCGDIHKISYPFRLKDDPQHCGDPRYELLCENNTTAFLFIDSIKHLVRTINYKNHTIRLAHPAVQGNDSCTFPASSPDWGDLMDIGANSSYVTRIRYYNSSGGYEWWLGMVWPINFLSCPFPLNDPLFIEIDRCAYFNANKSIGRHTYVRGGDWNPMDIRDLCRIDFVAMTSLPLIYKKNDVSLSEIHDSLIYGFELSWAPLYCDDCKPTDFCYFDGRKAICFSRMCNYTYLTLRKGNGSPKPRYFDELAGMLIILVYCIGVNLVLRIIIGMPFVFGLLIYKLRRRHLSVFDIIEGFLQSNNDLMPIRYSYSDIKKMTRGFREKLGQGGYASVYKGKLRSGIIVAVKVLNKPSGDGQDFINEVSTLGRIHHVNVVVKLVGYCVERSKRALVYDFMPNGSLEKYIYSRDHDSLNWDKKYEIAVGVARGIAYLHRGCDIQILHFDIKPHNILLDENFVPKISDFGLAKFYSTEKNVVTLTAARGTIGYVAPELINRSIGGVSYKADVYSFGMLLLEMVGLKRDMADNDHNSTQYFPDCIYDRFDKGKDIELGDADENDDNCVARVERMTIVALWCIQMTPSDRPSMSKVVEMLETEDEPLHIPPRPSQLPEHFSQNDSNQNWTTDSTDSIALLVDDASQDY